MKLSIIIPCFNGARTLGAQLDALARQRWAKPWEFILADNGSTDGSIDLVKSYGDRIANVRIVDASLRKGQPFALNTGAHAAAGESIAFTDADDEIGDGWVAAMGEALEQHEFVACRTDGTKLNGPGYDFSPQSEGVQTLGHPPWLPHAGGGTLGVRKKLFEAVGDFDDALPCLHDTDFCLRAQLLGAKLRFVPEAVLYLRNRSDFRGTYRQSLNWAEYGVILAKRYWCNADRSWPFWKRYAQEWLRLLRLSRGARGSAGKFYFARCLGRQIGRTKGILMRRGVPV